MKSVALGNFDGVHIGHQAVLQAAARLGDSVCLLFDKHPLEVLAGKAPERLLSRQQTVLKILSCGIKKITYADFAMIKDETPAQFFERFLMHYLHAGALSCGYNYSFGKDRAGDVAQLEALCKAHGVALTVAPPVEFEGEAVSSSRIRACIREGQIEKANQMLGYRFFFEEEIVEGKHLGRKLGFPTINQCFPAELVKPRAGVYASRVTIEDKSYRGVTNIGSNPTIGSDSFRAETYLFDFRKNAYGKTACVELCRFIREERKFESVAALQAQVFMDLEGARKDV